MDYLFLASYNNPYSSCIKLIDSRRPAPDHRAPERCAPEILPQWRRAPQPRAPQPRAPQPWAPVTSCPRDFAPVTSCPTTLGPTDQALEHCITEGRGPGYRVTEQPNHVTAPCIAVERWLGEYPACTLKVNTRHPVTWATLLSLIKRFACTVCSRSSIWPYNNTVTLDPVHSTQFLTLSHVIWCRWTSLGMQTDWWTVYCFRSRGSLKRVKALFERNIC